VTTSASEAVEVASLAFVVLALGDPGFWQSKTRGAEQIITPSQRKPTGTSPNVSQPLEADGLETLHRAAILETNQSAIAHRVSEAEEVVPAREREMFYGAGTSEEEEAARRPALLPIR
jgi:hypothetical protein